MRRFGFKPSHAATLRQNRAALEAMAPDGKLPADLHASAERLHVPKQRAVRSAPTDTTPEKDILRAVVELLAAHPRVLLAVRQNTGSASYEAATGRWAPVHFYSFIKRPEDMTIVDVWGFLVGGRPFAIETKNSAWKKPTDDRERRQAAYLAMVRSVGGIALFCTDPDQVTVAFK